MDTRHGYEPIEVASTNDAGKPILFVNTPLYNVYIKVFPSNLPPAYVHLSDHIIAQLLDLCEKGKLTGKVLDQM